MRAVLRRLAGLEEEPRLSPREGDGVGGARGGAEKENHWDPLLLPAGLPVGAAAFFGGGGGGVGSSSPPNGSFRAKPFPKSAMPSCMLPSQSLRALLVASFAFSLAAARRLPVRVCVCLCVCVRGGGGGEGCVY